MYKVDFRNKLVSLTLSFLLVFSLAVSIVPQTILAESASPYLKIITAPSGRQLIQASFPTTPPKVKVATVDVPEVHSVGVTNTLPDVPAFDWCYGCAATAAAMLFGYYDRNGWSNMYTGPTNGGVCPLDNSDWGYGECPLSATHNGIDGRATNGHVDDYWIDYLQPGPDPYIGNWAEHTPDCTGDFMGTNQWKYGDPIEANVDGGTMYWFEGTGDPLFDFAELEPTYRDGCHGMGLFAESRGYTVLMNFTQLIQSQGTDPDKGFTFADFQAEIDSGRPVLILVEGHAMLGYGYDTSGNTVYVHDTWDHGDHEMTWGGTYAGMQHFAVAVIELYNSAPPPAAPTLKSPTSGATVPTLTPRLEWNISSGATDYGLQVSTTSSFTTLLVDQTGITDLYYDIAPGTLSWNTTYYWRVNAKNSYGTSSWSSYWYFTAAVAAPPNAPSNLVATPISSSQIDLTWQDNSTDETGFKIERKTGAGSYVQIATVGAGVTSYSNTALSASTTYYYRVRAYNAAGDSDYSNEASATTLPPPSAPILTSPVDGATVPTLTPRLEWNISSGATDYGLQVSTTSSFTTLLVDVTGITNLYYDIAPGTLSWNTTYYWRVNASDSYGSTSSWSQEASFSTTGPTAWVNIDLLEQSFSRYWRVIATVTITENDSSGPAIAGATVYGNWSGVYSRTVSGTTNSAGKVIFYTSLIRDSGIVTFTVTRIVKNGQEYILSGETSESTGEPGDNPPTVNITSPLGGATVSGVVTVGADASDDAGVVQVDFYYGSTLIDTDDTAPYSVDWDSTAVADGVYTLTSTAIDTASQEASDSIGVTVDNDNPPIVSITSPPDGATVSGVVTIDADASDDVGVAQVDFYYGSTLIGTDDTAPYSVDWDSTAVADGVYTLTSTAIDTASQEASDSINVTVDNVNDPPVANAGPDQTVSDADGTGAETVILDGSGSYDPDGSISSYEWTEGGALLGTGETISHDFAVGTHTITLNVTDDKGASASDDCIINVVANQAPVANAGPDQSAYVGDSVTFDGSSSSDSDGSIVNYYWDFGDGESESGVTVSHAYSEAGTYTVTLTVTDNGGAVSEDIAIVTISEAPAAPTAWVNIDLLEQSFSRYWRVIATVTITENDSSGPAIAGATVYGNWSGVYSRTVSGTTNSAGKVIFYTSLIRDSGIVTFTVTRIVKNGQEYILSGETSESIG